MTSTTATDRDPGHLFATASTWADMDAWHHQVAELRETSPVFPLGLPDYDDVWVLTRHRDIFDVSRDNERWTNTERSVLGPDSAWRETLESGMPLPASLVQLDGLKHRQHRQVTNDWFKPAAVGRRQTRIDELADHFIDRMRTLDGECDFARDIAQPYTLRVIMDIYGVPEEDEALMMELTQGVFGAADPEFLGDADDPQAKVGMSIMRFIQYFGQITQDRQANPREDLASVIANGMIGDEPMGEVERLWYYIIVATAGHDTTSFALSGGMHALLENPDQMQALQDHPDLIVTATDEIIRWTTPVRHFLRYATEAAEIRGVEIPEGARVLMSYPSANRDDEVFTDPMTFDVRRPDADKLLSFGVGGHFCLGAQFARREIRTFLGRLLPQLSDIALAGDASWAESHFVSGVKHLPISYRFR